MERIVYLPLMGRIGNQLFQYSFAYTVQKELGKGTIIIIDDQDVISVGWKNALKEYELPNVSYLSEYDNTINRKLRKNVFVFDFYMKFIYNKDSKKQFEREKVFQRALNFFGVIAIEKGYCNYWINKNSNQYLFGYFQSERYFGKYSNNIKILFDKTEELHRVQYPYIELLENRNSVCISIKIEHNVGSDIYDVCDSEYYERGIKLIKSNVEDPLFFICSDNVEKAKELFVNGLQSDVVFQPKGHDISLTLSAMSKCKHFIINNTSFGWWAQYLSENPNKIVIAPKKWKNNDDPVGVYDNQDCWHLI